MNLLLNKCKKAERYFKERGVKFQSIDIVRYGISPGELKSVVSAVGSVDKLHKDCAEVKYLGVVLKLFENHDPIFDRTKKNRHCTFMIYRHATIGLCG
jgi:hypothetical protein